MGRVLGSALRKQWVGLPSDAVTCLLSLAGADTPAGRCCAAAAATVAEVP